MPRVLEDGHVKKRNEVKGTYASIDVLIRATSPTIEGTRTETLLAQTQHKNSVKMQQMILQQDPVQKTRLF